MSAVGAAACSAGTSGGGGSGGGAAVGPNGSVGGSTSSNIPDGSLTITPNPISVSVNGADVTVPVTANSTTAGDVTASTVFTVADASLGSFMGSTLTVPATIKHGGKTTVGGAYGPQSGSADLVVNLHAPDIVDPSAPPNVTGWFGNGDGAPAPAWAYPFDHTMIPRNQPELNFQWSAPSGGAGAYKIHFEGPTYSRDVYVGPSVCSGSQCQFQLTDSDWADVADALAGGDVTVSVSASASPTSPSGTAQIKMAFSPEDVKGGVYYWSTTITGIYRVPLGSKTATAFVQNDPHGCVGCHAVSPDGKKVAMEFGSAEGIGGGIVAGDNGQNYVVQPTSAGQWNLETFSPDGTKLLVNWHGALRVIDSTTGTLISNVDPTLLDSGYGFAQPEWSPDGNSIVFVRMPSGSVEWNANDTGDIMVMPYSNGAFGTPQMIVPKSGGEVHYYPTWSPDSQWIIYDSCQGCGTYNSHDTRLQMVRATPGSTPIDLVNATHQMNAGTNWPRSAPFIQQSGNLMFFTFSSYVPYGFDSTGSQPQIWMTAIDLSIANAQSGDPSYSPFWLTFQKTTESNHLATWTKSVACTDPSECPTGFDCINGECVKQDIPK